MATSEGGAYWAVALAGDDSDIRTIVSGGLGEEGVDLRKTDDGWLITADTFEAAGDARGVRRAAEAILDVVNGVGALLDRAFRPLKAGHVYHLHADGRKDAFVQLEGAIEARARVHAVLVSTTSDGAPAPVPTSQLDKALAAAKVDDNLAHALRLHGKRPPTIATLYKVFELSAQHPQHQTWSSRGGRSRFTHSANSPGAHGDDARHAVLRTQPPARPMNLDEAESFIARILVRWVEAVWSSILGV